MEWTVETILVMESDEIKTIVLSELSPQQKELYLSFLVEKNVVFARDVDGNYIAHVVVQPSVSPAPTLAVPSSSFRYALLLIYGVCDW